jgi:hypothetical protein
MTNNLPTPAPEPMGEVILYQSEDGSTRIEVQLKGDTVWLSQRGMADLFQTSVPNINQHLKTIYEDGELRPEATIKRYLIVQTEGSRQVSRTVDHYNLDAILAVGHRVRSHRGTQFRLWVTERLREYLVKGFAMDDARLKRAGGGSYFEELLARIRDIHSSERVFWRKVLDIYATSINYDPSTEASQLFFKPVQNKMHWAAHGHTAAEVIHGRADASQPHMGLTSWAGDRPRKPDVGIAKNYLNADRGVIHERRAKDPDHRRAERGWEDYVRPRVLAPGGSLPGLHQCRSDCRGPVAVSTRSRSRPCGASGRRRNP